MKMLIVGIDGLGKASLKALGLKRLSARMQSQGIVGMPEINNVISRGWPEIYTGKDAFQTGGFYQVPVYSNGKILPTQKTGLSKIKKIIDKNDLLWNVLNKLGYSVGVFTVPTVSEPETINGFCFAATGAGKFKSINVESEISPKDLLDDIRIDMADFGIRMGYGGVIPKDLLSLEKYLNKHISDYFYTLRHVLIRKHVDICFAATRFVAAMAFKFIGVCINPPKNAYEARLRELVLNVCDNFDEELDRLINDIDAEHLFIVSDHGVTEYIYDLNLNELLLQNGMMSRDNSIKSILKHQVNKIRSIVKGNPYLTKAAPRYRLEKSQFFSIGYMNAIYLRDSRFGGEKYTPDDAYEMSKSMSKNLNAICHDSNLDTYLHFNPIKTTGTVGADINSVHIPNIICNMQPGINNSERTKAILERKDFYFEDMLKKGFYGEHSGCKSNDTIGFYSGDREETIDVTSLTSIYESILRVVKS